MGVAIHILDRRTVRLDVGGTSQTVGTVRHLSKITEIDDCRSAELEGVAIPSLATMGGDLTET
jgi:hypothetical protein